MAENPRKLKKSGSGEPGSPIIIGDSSTILGGKRTTSVAFTRTKPNFFFTQDSATLYHVSATYEKVLVGSLIIPGINPDRIHFPWWLLLGNVGTVAAGDETLVTLTFKHPPDSTSGSAPNLTALFLAGDMSSRIGSVVIQSPSLTTPVSVGKGDRIEIHFQTPDQRRAKFKRK